MTCSVYVIFYEVFGSCSLKIDVISQDVIGQYQMSFKLLFAAQKCTSPRVRFKKKKSFIL